MANPNINSPTSCYANNAQVSLSTTTETQLVSNAAASGKVFLIDSIILTNVSAAAVTIYVTFWNAATNTGTSTRLASAISLTAGTTLPVSIKSHGVNLKEAQSIYCTATVANAVTCTAYWKEFS